MNPVIATFVVLGVAIVAFVSGKVPLAVVAVGVSLALWATGVLGIDEALAGFADPTVILIACLFVVSEALDATGVTAWVGQQVIRRAGTHRIRLTLVIVLISAALTAFISINGAVAALIPVVVVVAARAGIVPSKLLLPLAFAASAGSLLTLTGSPVNLLLSEAAAASGGRAFGFFEFALVGGPIVLVTAAILALAGGRLLPERSPERLAEGVRDGHAATRTLRKAYRLADDHKLIGTREGVAEVMITPRSSLIGREVSVGMTTRDESLVILAVRHGGIDATEMMRDEMSGRTIIQAGDAVLVQGPWDALERYVRSSDVIPVTSPHALRRTVPLGQGAKRSLGILIVMVVLLATGVVPPVVTGLVAVGALVLTGVLTVPQVFRSIAWTTVVLIAGMIPLSTAFSVSGADLVIAELVLGMLGDASPHVALLVLGVLTIVLGQFISNVATVLVIAPISLALAQSLEVSVLPFMMSLVVVGAASFLTPIATPANLMVMQPAGYRFGDYWRLGVPITAVFLAFAVLYVPVLWPF